jgi:hypothetical protein
LQVAIAVATDFSMAGTGCTALALRSPTLFADGGVPCQHRLRVLGRGTNLPLGA